MWVFNERLVPARYFSLHRPETFADRLPDGQATTTLRADEAQALFGKQPTLNPRVSQMPVPIAFGFYLDNRHTMSYNKP
jgi:hypothetical protein